MVVVNLYAFEKTAGKPGAAFSDIIENIDIGGPSMVRSAAKNFEDVAIVTSVADYAAIADELAANGGSAGAGDALAAGAGGLCGDGGLRRGDCDDAGEHCCAGAAWRAGDLRRRGDAAGDARDRTELKTVLRYGENPHQRAALYVDGSGRGVAAAKQLQGKELSYNNIVDLDACWELVGEFERPRTRRWPSSSTPTHAARRPERRVVEAYQRALEADPVSAFGSVIGINREVDAEAAEEIAKLFVEAIVAPSFTAEAVARFAAKKNLRLLEIAPRADRTRASRCGR